MMESTKSKEKRGEEDRRSTMRQLRAMLRKNWLLKIRNPFVTSGEVLLPTLVMLLLMAVRSRVDTRVHLPQPYIRKGMLVEVGKGGISAPFEKVLEIMCAKHEYLAFAPDTYETRMMIEILSIKFPLLKLAAKIFRDEEELETYIHSDIYGAYDEVRNSTNPKIKGAVVFHDQGPQWFDYSIRLNHTWAFSGFPDVKSIMDVNGPYLNDLQLGVNMIPIMQYSYSEFLTLQQVIDSFIIFASQQNMTNSYISELAFAPLDSTLQLTEFETLWTQFSPKTIRLVPFPTREYTDDEFQSIVKRVMGVLYLLGFLYPISRLISYFVFEKEKKFKEGLYMMGVSDNVFNLSWFITYAFQFAISSAIVTVSTMGTLFKYSDTSLVFVYFFCFGLSSISLSFLISAFFTRAKTAVAVGTLAFLAAFFPYYTVDDEGVPTLFKVLASFLSPTAFALGSINFADYEQAHVGLRWSNMWRESSGVCFLVCLLLMVLDTLLYYAAGLYLDKVFYKDNGSHIPPVFSLLKKFWRKKSMNGLLSSTSLVKLIDTETEENTIISEIEAYKPAVELINFEMKQQELDGRCIQIRNLHKVYTSRKAELCAVNSLQMTLYENQILALLGHNGAGKSTTLSMLIGLVRPTSGDALIFGKNILTDMDEIRRSLGVCPQHDILFPELTVKEHLEIFSDIKGVKEDSSKNVVIEMAEEVGLSDKLNTFVRALSGGMRRKLSLGIALIGNSKVIVLDEPTSGMDPYSMRLTWQLIKRFKKGRIILLTTHSMDEADALGDRIAIMANGSLKCCGSSFFLKQRYGVGYTLTLVKTSPNASAVADIIYSHVPSAICISDVGNEISFKLPLLSSASFESMFREIEYCMQRPSPGIEGISDNHESSNFGIESYGISVTTLEEVFLGVAGGDFDETECSVEQAASSDADQLGKNDSTERVYYSKIVTNYIEVIGFILSMIGKAGALFFATTLHVIKFIGMQCCYCNILRSTFFRHSRALLIKRAVSARRDQKTIVFQLVIPAFFLLLGLMMISLKPHPDQKSVTFTTSHFNPLLAGGGGGGPVPFNISILIAEEVSKHVHGGWIQRSQETNYQFPDSGRALNDAIESAGPSLGPILLSMSQYLMSSFNKSYQSRYGAVVMDKQSENGSLGYTVLHNSSCQHSAATHINLINSAILRLATHDESMMITTRNHPLPMTKSQRQQHHDLDAFRVAIVVSMAFAFIPASFAVAIVKEREVKAKHQQLISGVSVISYWASTYLWDFISFLIPSSFAFILFFIFGLDQFIGQDSLLSTILMFLGYGASLASSTYCLTFFFNEHSMAQNVILLVQIFTGLILMAISFVMGLIDSTARTNSLLKNFFRLSPGFCFADGLASLALLRGGVKGGLGDTIFSWNVTGASIFYLAVEAIVYFLLTLVLEVFPHKKILSMTSDIWTSMGKNIYTASTGSMEPLLKTPVGDIIEDIDVQIERKKVLSGGVSGAIACLCNLRKVYSSGKRHDPKVAVESLTFSVQEGECFGFLGTNGAGKTTTLSMLTGEEHPTDGTADIFGTDIRLNPKASRKHIGYCPQFDALLEFVTPREHLEFFARIKGVEEYHLEQVVLEKLAEFDLLKHADKPAYALSGGNKRKLSVAIAMIGDPPLVILDEPSTGMDPMAKRFMWEVISRLSTRRGKTAVILTTHSMNEAQALCTRIGIMVGGKLRCIGSPQHLKNRFGNHLELEVKPTDVSPLDLKNLSQTIQQKFFHAAKNHQRSIFDGLEVCIGVEAGSSESAPEISLANEMVATIRYWLGDAENSEPCICDVRGVFVEQLTEQLIRDGGIQLALFSEWWLTKEKFSAIDLFVQSSFPGATYQGCDGLSVKYQLRFGEDLALADIFGYIEKNRNVLGIAEYSISQSTLESIFNHFASNP